MRKGKTWLILGVTVLLVGLIAGCVPLEPEMSYQGQLTNPSGNPVPDGNYEMIFRLYNDAAAAVGGEVYSETQTVAVDGGLFNVNLGAVNPITPSSFFAGKLWLGVEVEGDGEMTPRQQLTGAPYAMSLVPGAVVGGAVNSNAFPGGTLFVANSGTGYGVGVLVSNATSMGVTVGGQGTAATGVNIGGFTNAIRVTSGDNGLIFSGVDRGGWITTTDGAGLQLRAYGGPTDDNDGIRALGFEDKGAFFWSQATAATSASPWGASIRSEEDHGVYAFTVNGTYGGYFADPIYVNGGCTGCAFRYIARNTSEITLQPGEAVVAAGVETGIEGMQSPVMKVAPAMPGQTILGVVVGRTENMILPESEEHDVGIHFGRINGAAAPGDYLVIVVQGPAQVKADPAAGIQAGSLVYLGAGGVTTEAGGPAIGMALDVVDESGLVWVLVGFR